MGMKMDKMAAARNDDEKAVDTRYEVAKETDSMAAARNDDERRGDGQGL